MKAQILILFSLVLFSSCRKDNTPNPSHLNQMPDSVEWCTVITSEDSHIELFIKDSLNSPVDSCAIWTYCHMDQCHEPKFTDSDGFVSFDVIYQFEFGYTPDLQEIYLEKDSITKTFNIILNKGDTTEFTHFIN